MKLIEDHLMLGVAVEYSMEKNGVTKIVKGKVTGVRRGQPMLDMDTRVINSKTVQLRIKPDDGTRAIWTTSMKETSSHG